MTANKIAYIQANWHTEITDPCKISFLKTITAKGYKESDIEFFLTPGSLEIPLLAKKLAKTNQYLAICASGFIVNGGIYRHDFVSSTVIDAIMHVQLETEIPILSAILTPINFHEHETHQSFFTQHMTTKGEELANACVATINNLKRFN